MYKSVKEKARGEGLPGLTVAIFRLLTLISRCQKMPTVLMDNMEHSILKYIYKMSNPSQQWLWRYICDTIVNHFSFISYWSYSMKLLFLYNEVKWDSFAGFGELASCWLKLLPNEAISISIISSDDSLKPGLQGTRLSWSFRGSLPPIDFSLLTFC